MKDLEKVVTDLDLDLDLDCVVHSHIICSKLSGESTLFENKLEIV